MDQSTHLDSASSADGHDTGIAADLKQAANNLAGETMAEAQDIAEDLKEKAEPLKREAETFAEGKKAQGARRVKDFAAAIHQAADELSGQSPAAARYIHASADKLESASGMMREKSVGELFDEAGQLTRERPLMGFAGSVAAGFLLARLLRASANH
ncbi:MAG TPA: hypothetical protein VN718_08890 [Rhizomicrobium sp.]|nr:hypothetical protein [Rhizomicrobium sp.]